MGVSNSNPVPSFYYLARHSGWRDALYIVFLLKLTTAISVPSLSPAVDGGWTDWIYSPCHAQCGPGKQNRTRACSNPLPSGGGKDCPGPDLETVDCNNGPCVGKLL